MNGNVNILVGQGSQTGSSVYNQPYTNATQKEADNRIPVTGDTYTRGNAGSDSVGLQQGNGIPAAKCRCGNCQACAAQAYEAQGKSVSQGTLSLQPEKDIPAGSGAESEEQTPDSISSGPKGVDGDPLTREEILQLAELKKRDRAVRSHEQAHMTAAAGIVTKGMSFSYQKGPDGRRYAVGGEVQIDVSKEGTPNETIAKMQKVRAAALAPVQPSSQDRRVAASATTKMSQAKMELRAEQMEEAEAQREAMFGGNSQQTEASSDTSKAAKPTQGNKDDIVTQQPVKGVSLQNNQITAYSKSQKTFLISNQFTTQA